MKNLNANLYFLSTYIFLLCLASPRLNAQEDALKTAPSTTEEFVAALKKSALLVRLQDKSKTIAVLKEKGLIKQAEELAQMQHQENREILLSFAKTFDFCPVYFFYAKDSEAIRNGDLGGVIFDANLKLIPLSINQFFTAEFAETPDLGIDGLIIRDKRLLALDNDLPFFERRFVFFNLKERSKAEIVEAYNKRMHDYSNFYQSKKKVN